VGGFDLLYNFSKERIRHGLMFNNRSVIEIMVITFTLIVSSSMLLTGAAVAFIEIRNPDADTSTAVDFLFTVITVVMGALLGLLAGKNENIGQLSERPKEQDRHNESDN
jgi:hypothetical protein